MLLLRPVRAADLSDLYELSLSTGGGLTTLPADRDVLAAKIALSEASFHSGSDALEDAYYLFALEDLARGKVVGTSGIFASVGQSKPFYSYRILKLTQVSHQPDMKVDTQLLQLVNDYAGATELGTLFLHPDYRKGHAGALLSKARYLMLAACPGRFSEKVMAEIRGWTDENGQSPFWDAIGRHFFGMDFQEADHINGMGNNQFIADLMPKFPIYTNLLPQEAQDVIGKPHDGARGAVRLLMDEGFRNAGAVDIFDGGPCFEVPRHDIRTLRKARSVRIGAIGTLDVSPGSVSLVAVADMPDFRIIATHMSEMNEEQVAIGQEAANALSVKEGDALLVSPLVNRRKEEPVSQTTTS
ncbi:arginine N-succinyltransferase [Iodidimonas muriae]|uniref:Arginine N-succinyltransferase n=1 Tax=Iodidimonas muriae TaxID=261467 RepID=A0ABQ2LB26_9PROT|nr:arginine N-succinyltransferase [Iodidimonas muriae]GER08057.1 arginine N-succinyltransferase [Kordiimonadales bacterium JCM 17843]GGO09003.1 arginine N-succinyltransferase [Iodidimonas muriae]